MSLVETVLLTLQFSVVIIAPGETIQFAHAISEKEPGIIPLQGDIVWPTPASPRFEWAADGPKGGAVLVEKETLKPKLLVSKPGRYVVQLVVSDGRTIKNAAVAVVVLAGKARSKINPE